ncbi:hypothetical protein LTR56_010255 [Elasticomyces elasticus]|nr:hypothetical protein LTR56_010255 [Elasticomyces elasticus]KAK3658309.1 hypothetical protein LTR22_009010 [Elasticomyces elasticus]KAK4922931.1 hypothetical protein LTR49_009762 [Elasticomyces elasticus]KAK5745213.1 hypothetical protein LTS12_023219 [Elasticomyces elasticus]
MLRPPGSDLFDDDEFGVNFGLPLPRGHGPGLEGLLSSQGAMLLGTAGRGSVFDDLDDFDDLPPRRPGMMPGNAGRGHLPDEFDDGDGFSDYRNDRTGRMLGAGGRGHLPDEFDDGDGFSDYRNDRPGRSGGGPRDQRPGRSGARQSYGQSRYSN